MKPATAEGEGGKGLKNAARATGLRMMEVGEGTERACTGIGGVSSVECY